MSYLPGRPNPEEHAPFYGAYIARVPGEDPVAVLAQQLDELLPWLRQVAPERQEHRYAAGKWSVREVVSHLIDAERIFSYRALRIARGDAQPMAGFDENAYVARAELGTRPYTSVISELENLRRANLELFRHLSAAAWQRCGEANGVPVSVRALAFILAGHCAHHQAILRERYGIA